MPDLFGGGGGGGGGSSGSWQFVSHTSITAVANIDFTGLSAGFDYLFSIRNAIPAASTTFAGRLSQSGVFDTGTHYAGSGLNSGQSSILFTNTTVSGTVANGGVSADIILLNPGDTSANLKTIIGNASTFTNGPSLNSGPVAGRFFPGNTNAVDGIRFFFTSQNFVAQGDIYTYTRKLS